MISGFIVADDKIPEKPETQEIVVTASRREVLLADTPDIVQVISRKQIESINPSSTGELIQYATGVTRSTGTGSGLPDRSVISMNGLPPNYTLVMLNGVHLLTDHMHTGQNIEMIPPESIERIEIMRGAASAQYGADAIGGIVNIITHKKTDKASGQVGVAVGSYNTYESNISVQSPAGNNVTLSTFLNWEKSDGLPLKAPAHRIDKTGCERMNLLSRADASLTENTDIFIWLNWVQNTMDWQTSTADSVLLSPVAGINHKLSPSLNAFGQISYSDWDAKVNEEKNRLSKAEGHLTLQASDSHTVMTGAECWNNQFERTAVTAPEQSSYGAFIQDEWIATEQLALMSAIRYDKTEDIEGAVSPKISLMFAPSDRIRARASIGRGFHAPTLQELYEEGYGHGGTAYRFGNPNLDPEYSATYTAGLEGKPTDSIKVMLYGYYSDLEDMIVPVFEGPWDKDPSIDVWRRTNIKSAEVYGAEISLLINLTDQLTMDCGYTITENQDKDTGRQLPYSPGSSVYAKLSHISTLSSSLSINSFIGIQAGFNREAWNWQPVANTPADNQDGLTTKLDDYSKLDAGLTLNISDSYKVFLKVENILGEDIVNLDDSYTVLDGEPFVRVGLNYNFDITTGSQG